MTALDAQPGLAERAEPRALCAHCRLPVPPDRVERGPSFCCAACCAVYRAIHDCGLQRYYDLLQRMQPRPRPAQTTGGGYESFDDPAFAAMYSRAAAGGRVTTELHLDNVHCAACVWIVERLPRVLPGLVESRLEGRTVRLTWDPQATALSQIARRLDRIGYPPHPARGRGEREQRRAEDRRMLVRIAVAGAAAGNAMLVAFALYGGMLHGMEPALATLLRWASMGIAAVSLAWPGRVFFQRAVAAVAARVIHMDVPIALGLAAGFAWSALATIRGRGDVYFESLTVLVFLLLAGRWLQARRQQAGRDAVEMLFCMTPGTARLVEGDAVREVPVEALAVGAVVEVPAGAAVPADGNVVTGRSAIDRSLLTGESRPVPVGPGEAVCAGTVNVAAPVRVAVTATGEATRVGRLMLLFEESAARRAPVVRMADRLAGWFSLAVIVLAAGTLALWLAVDPARAVPNALALLIVTCPCALALATPLAVVAAIGRAARAGILIKGGDVIERLRGRGLVLLDKTGTLTSGRTQVVTWHGPARLQGLAAAVERHSSHPVAAAIVAAYGRGDRECRDVHASGHGISATVEGRRISIGSRQYVAAEGAAIPPWAIRVEAGLVSAGVSPVFIAEDGVVGAVGGLDDPVKPDAAAAIDALRRLGWRVGVLSGDHPDVVRAVAGRLGIEPDACRGGLSPERKQSIVRDESARQPVVMVGDGVNDAAALAAASVGVAVRGGAECSLMAADVYLSQPGLGSVPQLVRGARRTCAVIRRNLAISLVYNAAAVTLAVAGLMNPLLAAVLMPLSSLSVLSLSYRSRSFEAAPCP